RISVVIGTPARLAAWRYSLCGAIAGEVTTRSHDVKSDSRCLPRQNSISSPFSLSIDSASFSASSLSVTSTLAPWETSQRLTSIPPPKRPRPATVTRFSRSWPHNSFIDPFLPVAVNHELRVAHARLGQHFLERQKECDICWRVFRTRVVESPRRTPGSRARGRIVAACDPARRWHAQFRQASDQRRAERTRIDN